MQSFTPKVFLLSVWPLSFSLATTHKISFDFFSSSYLDVSVRKVPSLKLWIHFNVVQHDLYGVSPFGHLRIKAYLLLPEAYRSLSRPSSAPNAKAFSLCSFSLELFSSAFANSFLTWVSQIGSFSLIVIQLPAVRKNHISDLKLPFLLDFTILLSFVCSSQTSICLLFLYSVFKVHFASFRLLGGLKWIRTIDLALIRRAL